MPTINDSGFTPAVLPPFSALAIGADYRTNAGAYRTKVGATAGFDWVSLTTLGQNASEVVEQVQAVLTVTSL